MKAGSDFIADTYRPFRAYAHLEWPQAVQMSQPSCCTTAA